MTGCIIVCSTYCINTVGAIIIKMIQSVRSIYQVFCQGFCRAAYKVSHKNVHFLRAWYNLLRVNLLRILPIVAVTLLTSEVAISKDSLNPYEPVRLTHKKSSSIQLQRKLEDAIAEKKGEIEVHQSAKQKLSKQADAQTDALVKTGPPKPESTALLVIPPEFEAAGVFHKGSAPVRVDGKWGLINTQGKWILAPTFTEIGMYCVEGILPVKMDDKYGYINYLGTPITDYRFDEVKPFSEGLAAVRVDDQWGFIHPDGKWYISPRFDDALSFKGGVAPVKFAAGWGYAYRSNKWLSLPLFQQTYEFSEGYGVIKKNNLLGLVDSDGNTSIKPTYGWAKSFANGVLPVATKAHQWIFVDDKGETVIDEVYQDSSSFSEGLVSVKKNNKWGYINIKNEVVIPFEFDRAYNFNEGVAVVVQNGDRFFIDKQGRALSQPFEDIFRVSEGFAAVKVKDKWGYVFISALSVIGEESSTGDKESSTGDKEPSIL